jgi:hypothetical protein
MGYIDCKKLWAVGTGNFETREYIYMAVTVLFLMADLTENTKGCYVYTLVFSISVVGTTVKAMYNCYAILIFS